MHSICHKLWPKAAPVSLHACASWLPAGTKTDANAYSSSFLAVGAKGTTEDDAGTDISTYVSAYSNGCLAMPMAFYPLAPRPIMAIPVPMSMIHL